MEVKSVLGALISVAGELIVPRAGAASGDQPLISSGLSHHRGAERGLGNPPQSKPLSRQKTPESSTNCSPALLEELQRRESRPLPASPHAGGGNRRSYYYFLLKPAQKFLHISSVRRGRGCLLHCVTRRAQRLPVRSICEIISALCVSISECPGLGLPPSKGSLSHEGKSLRVTDKRVRNKMQLRE